MFDVTFHNTGSTAHDLTFADGTKIGGRRRQDGDRHGHGPGGRA